MLQINNDNVFSDSRDEKSLSEENKRLLYILKSAGIKEWNGTERIVSILEDIQLRVPYLLAGFPKNLFAVIEQLFQVPYPLFYRPLIWWKDNSFYLMKVCSVGFGDEVSDRTLTCCKTLLLQIEYVGALVRPAFTYLYLKKKTGFI